MSPIPDRLETALRRSQEIEETMARPEVATNFEKIRELTQERTSLEALVAIGQQRRRLLLQQEDLKSLLEEEADPALAEMEQAELESLENQLVQLDRQLQEGPSPGNPSDDQGVIVEIRSGTGGQEASLFANDLFRMYANYAQTQGWQIDVLEHNPSSPGGLNKIVFEVLGRGTFSQLKHERGVHRVQRVPETEAQGRIHTSTATVAVLPQDNRVEVHINLDDLRIDTFHASGHGGQHVNKVATAVRIVHLPTGLMVVCQDERSQQKNRQLAMTRLRARLQTAEQERLKAQATQDRRSQVGTAQRAEKIRTYNYPHDRVTDHRIPQRFHGIHRLMAGQLHPIINALTAQEQSPSKSTH